MSLPSKIATTLLPILGEALKAKSLNDAERRTLIAAQKLAFANALDKGIDAIKKAKGRA